MVNKEGWALSAWHIIEEFARVHQEASDYQQAEAARNRIIADSSIDKKERTRQLKTIPKKTKASITHASSWWSIDGVGISDYRALPVVDLALFKLNPFDPSWMASYPLFKDPGKPIDQGKSLCRIGFPFHTIEPVFSLANNTFELPAGSIPMPLFPNDGILTRVVDVTIDPAAPQGVPPPFPLRFIETSSPGLRGQSGGPVFDANGVVWGIQSRTIHYPLGFSPPVPDGKPHEKEHQFLNVGWAVHVETIVGMLRHVGIDFSVADY